MAGLVVRESVTLAGRAERARSGPGTVLPVWSGLIAAALRGRSCTLLAGTRKAAGGFRWWQVSRRGGLAAAWRRTVTWFELLSG
jgi:hypothetical protein